MKRWMKYVKPYMLYFILGPLCMIIEVIGEVLMPLYLAEVINAAIDGSITAGSSLIVMAKMIGTALLMMLGGVGGSYFGAKASVNFASDLRSDLFKKVQGYSFANIDKFSTGSLVTRLTNDVTQMQNFINMMLRMMLRSPGMLIGGVIMAIRLSPSLSIVMAVTLPLLLGAMAFIIFRGMPRFARMQTKIDGLNSTVQENITNVRVVKSFTREGFETDKFESANADLKGAGMSAMKNMILMSPVQSFFMYITTGLVIWFGSQIVISNYDTWGLNAAFSVGELSSFINYVSQILFSLMMVTFMLMFSSRALASAKRISEVLDEKIDIIDTEDCNTEATIERGEIEFKNVTYRYYKNSEDPVLANINLTIPAGSTVGIIGSTGCGKTTLVSLIPRLYDTDEGEVLIDGINVKDYSLHNLREGVGMVLQKNVLFSGTIEENLRWGDEDATDEQIFAAAESAQADKFVKNFTNGYQTELGQGGVNVSGGQKQRLCIARALLKSPKIIILDDSTSAVDTATEAQIRRAFREELGASTKIIIAQRISSVKDADMIVVMDDGKITGIGTHDALMQNNVEYQEIYNSQISGKDGN
ncbi:MAG: ABC transporter ATP-binding protein [Clostridia bacterium]|nr:ABC transporter ATP-binding protein [Clostridia bacterium]